jgi:hypothetical protein
VTISRIHSYLVHPSKSEQNAPAIGGLEVPHSGKLFQMLSGLEQSTLAECDIDIMFKPSGNGKQQNDCRDLLLTYLAKPTIANGRSIASRLQSVTTRRSGLGLLFIIAAHDQQGFRLLLSRFPAETGVTAEEHGRTLDVQFVEKVFMKNVRSYKSVFYRCQTTHTGFWDGVAVDRQMVDTRGSADYWIREFLASDLRNTAAAGTKRMASAVQDAIRTTTDPSVRHELISAAQIIRNQDNRITSAAKIVGDLALTEAAGRAIQSAFSRPELYGSTFQFDLKEFDDTLLFRSVELDNGAMLIAENATFDRVIRSEPLGRNGTAQRFITEGQVVSERLRKTR